MSTRAEVLYHDNDMVLEVSGLKNKVTDAYLNSATVQGTLKKENGTNFTGQSWPLALVYVTDSNGIYRGTLSKDIATESETVGWVEITADAGLGLFATFRIPIQFNWRRN